MILSISCHADRAVVVFDTYKVITITNTERMKRSFSSIKFQRMKSDHPVKQWNNLLSFGENKPEIIEFIIYKWTGSKYLESETAFPFYVTSKYYCY